MIQQCLISSRVGNDACAPAFVTVIAATTHAICAAGSSPSARPMRGTPDPEAATLPRSMSARESPWVAPGLSGSRV